MQIGPSEILLALAVLAGGLNALTYFQRRNKPTSLVDLGKRLDDDIGKIRDDVRELQVKIGPFWRVIEEQTLKVLKA